MRKGAFWPAACVLALALHAGEPRQTRVTITSQPSGASVIIDGRDRGTTPVTLFDLAPGRHHLRYRLAGYEEKDRFFDPAEGPIVEKNVVLEEEKGLLLLKTEPSGCDVQIDGVSVGVTPCLVTHLAARNVYAVRLRKAGYQTQTISVRFDGRRPVVREEKLVLASGTIDIQSEPSGAEVMVNGIVRGVTPLRVTDVAKGRAVVKFHLDGFEDEVRELAINAGDVQNLPVVLKGLPGTMQLTSVPSGARLYVNNEARGTAPLTLRELKAGTYEVRAELEGYGTETRTVVLGNGSAAREEFRLSNVMGRIEVRTCPPGAQVFLDGRLVGTTQAKDPNAEFSDILAIENVLEGEHALVMKKDGYSDLTRHPRVRNSQTAKYHRQRLAQIFIPDVEIVTARGSYRGVLTANRPEYVEIEVSLGIRRSFPRDEIRKINFLKAEQ